MAEVRHLISRLSQKHILAGAPESYARGFATAASNVYSAKEIESVLQRKFFIPDDSRFDLDSYQQSAAELSVQNHLVLERRAKNFERDKRVNPPKDVDAYYEVGATRVSLEVKCPVEVEPPEDPYVVTMGGRVSGYLEKFNRLKGVMESNPENSVDLAKNKDNTLKDFLVSAHDKFSVSSGVDDLNILFIACGDCASIQDWYFYLYGNSGLFTGDPFHPSPQDYGLVDVVALSSLRYCHAHAQGFHDWTLRDVFLLPCVNPHRRSSAVSESFVSGLNIFDHHLKRFNAFTPESEAGQSLKVLHYVVEKLAGQERARYFPVETRK